MSSKPKNQTKYRDKILATGHSWLDLLVSKMCHHQIKRLAAHYSENPRKIVEGLALMAERGATAKMTAANRDAYFTLKS